MTRIGIIIGSTRPNRVGEQVARWVLDRAAGREDAEFGLIDLRDHPLPHLNEPVPAMRGAEYEHEHTRVWSSTIAAYDGYVLVTPEYNNAAPPVLVNALNFLFHEWANKAVGLVSYGVDGGARAAAQLRMISGPLQMADVAYSVTLSLFTHFENFSVLKPDARATASLTTTLDQVVAWSAALAPLRAASVR